MIAGIHGYLPKEIIAAASAGIASHGLDPLAVRVVAEAGVDISVHSPKQVDELQDQPYYLVVAVCGHANETCPVFPGWVKRMHVGVADPPQLAHHVRTD